MRDELIRLGWLVTGDRLESTELIHYLLGSISQVDDCPNDSILPGDS
jgi:hypothetical protein